MSTAAAASEINSAVWDTRPAELMASMLRSLF